MKKTFRTLLTAIMIFTIAITCAPMLSAVLGQSANAAGTAFSLNLVSENDTEAVVSVNLESGNFMNATFILETGDGITKCTKIVRGETLKAEQEIIDAEGGIVSFAANPAIGKIAFASTEEFTKPGEYFLFTVEKNSPITLLHKNLSFVVEDIEATVANNIPKSQSGTCGANLKWNLDYETGVLRITGTGAMSNYASKESPFGGNKRIKTVVLDRGVTSIGDYAFENCVNMTTVNSLENLKTIGNYAFSGCSLFTGFSATNKIEVIGNGALNGCTKITSITLDASLKSIGANAFEGTGLKSVIYKDTKFRWNKVVKASPNAKLDSAVISFSGLETGDVNDDGSINSTDALAVLKDIVQIEKIPAANRAVADTTHDGIVNSNDALQILLFNIGKIDKF